MADITHIFGGPFEPEVENALKASAEEQLKSAMIASGITPPQFIQFDGEMHRFKSGTKGGNGRETDKAGWYVAFAGPRPAGVFGCWRSDINQSWRADTGRNLTDYEERVFQERIKNAQINRDTAIKNRYENASKSCSKFWEQAQEASDNHEYLMRKGIKANGAKVTKNGQLILPLYASDGTLSTLQFIHADGTKRFFGGGKTKGAYWMIGEQSEEEKGVIYIAEGFATAATIFEETNRPCVAAYSASNLERVTKALREKNGDAQELVIVADNDRQGIGKKYADRAAKAHGAKIIMPPVEGDANDYKQAGRDLAALLVPPKAHGWMMPVADFCAQPAPTHWMLKKWLPKNGLVMIHGPSGGGKAQPLSEPVLTPNGWAEMGNIKAGDYVIGSMGLPIMVQSVHPQGRKTVWEVEFSNGEVVRCCKDHLWTVKKSNDSRTVTLTTEHLQQKPHKTHWKIPLTAPISFAVNGNPLPIDPYVLGCLIGDGGLTAYVGFSTQDEFIANEISKRLPSSHVIRRKHGCDYQIISERGQPNHVWTALRLLALAGKKSDQKFVPDEYMTASPLARLELLQGLMDTDGYVSASNGTTADFSNSSLKLVQQVRELVMSLGGIANAIRTKQTAGLDCHTVTFKMQEGCVPFLLPRKAERCAFGGHNLNLRVIDVRETNQSEEMQCIKVLSGDHLYVTRGYVLTHNTFVTLDWCLSVAANLNQRMGQKVRGGTIVYLAGEGHHGLKGRIVAWLQHNNVDLNQLDMYLSESGCDLNTKQGYQMAINHIDNLPTLPAIIVVDTLHGFLAGDENSAQDAKTMIDACKALINQFGCAVVLVHHTGVNQEAQHRARGSSAWRGALDIEISIVPNETNNCIEIIQRKNKDAELQPPLYCRLEPIAIDGWFDEDGEQLTSAIVIEETAPIDTAKDDEKIAKNMKIIELAWQHHGKKFIDEKPYLSQDDLLGTLTMQGINERLAVSMIQSDSDDSIIGCLLSSQTISQTGEGWTVESAEYASCFALTLDK